MHDAHGTGEKANILWSVKHVCCCCCCCDIAIVCLSVCLSVCLPVCNLAMSILYVVGRQMLMLLLLLLLLLRSDSRLLSLLRV